MRHLGAAALADVLTLSVTGPTGDAVFSNGGFVSSAHVVAREAPAPDDCRIEASTQLDATTPTGGRVTLSTHGHTGTVEVRGPTGAGRPFRFDGTVYTAICRVDGALLGDAFGLGTLDGEPGYLFRVAVQDYDAAEPDYIRVSLVPTATGVPFFFEENWDVPAGNITITNP